MDFNIIKTLRKIQFLFLLLLLSVLLASCASNTPDTAGKHENDPFESINREIFAFNNVTDEYIIGPIARGYRDFLPDPVIISIRNFLLNLNTPLTVINSTLQGDFNRAFTGVGRFTINSTIGLLGLIDVADYSHVPDGPGVMLVAHEGFFSLDQENHQPGLAGHRHHHPASPNTGFGLRQMKHRA